MVKALGSYADPEILAELPLVFGTAGDYNSKSTPFETQLSHLMEGRSTFPVSDDYGQPKLTADTTQTCGLRMPVTPTLHQLPTDESGRFITPRLSLWLSSAVTTLSSN